jgi:hypothetical protein
LQNDSELFESGSLACSADYSLHPLVIGDGFEPDDIFVNVVNPISRRMSGEQIFDS